MGVLSVPRFSQRLSHFCASAPLPPSQAAQVKERDRQVATAKVDTGLTKKREKSIDQVGGSIPSASAQSSGAALAKFGERKSATKSEWPDGGVPIGRPRAGASY